MATTWGTSKFPNPQSLWPPGSFAFISELVGIQGNPIPGRRVIKESLAETRPQRNIINGVYLIHYFPSNDKNSIWQHSSKFDLLVLPFPSQVFQCYVERELCNHGNVQTPEEVQRRQNLSAAMFWSPISLQPQFGLPRIKLLQPRAMQPNY